MKSVWRIALAGIVVAALVAAGGWEIGRARFGESDEAALKRMENELGQRFASSAGNLDRIVSRVAAEPTIIESAPRGQDAARRLFDMLDTALPENEVDKTGITVYGQDADPISWAGRPSESPKSRINGPRALFVAPGALGPRLVRVEPIVNRSRPIPQRIATIIVEQQLGPVRGVRGTADTFVISTSIVPAALRVRLGDVSPPASYDAYTFVIRSPGGGPLVDVEVRPADLAAVRTRWQDGTRAAVLAVLGLTLLVFAGPLLELRRRARNAGRFVAATLGLIGAIAAARIVFWFAATSVLGSRPLLSPIDLLLTALAVVAMVWLAFDTVERWRVAGPRPRVLLGTPESLAWIGLAYAAAGMAAPAIVWLYERLLQRVVAETTFDLIQFSLHPVSGTRISLAFALVLLHASVVWAAVTITRLPSVWRTRRLFGRRLALLVWLAGVLLTVFVIRTTDPGVQVVPLLAGVGAVGLGSTALVRLRHRARHSSQAAQLWVLFLALLVPAFGMYPSLLAFTTAAKERLIETDYAPKAGQQRSTIQSALTSTLDQIDAKADLPELVVESGEEVTPKADRASLVWSGTDLDTYQLTSAVELYGPDGRLVSRFALLLPAYQTTRHYAEGCTWEVPLDETLPFGSSQRHVLRTSRGICDHGRILGAIVVSVMLDYRTVLPFIESPSPYLESLQLQPQIPAEGAFGHDVEFVAYGWSRTTYTSGTSVWPLVGPVFQRLVASREPFWTDIFRNGVLYHVYLTSDRGGIYAFGYPAMTSFWHLVNLAELVFLTGALYIGLLTGATLLNAITAATPASGRALLTEFRASFYRKLFLAFVAAAVAPVVILSVATRTYFATQFRAGVEEAAAKTATVAQRLVEDYATFQQRGSGALATLDDQIMVLVQRAIDQDVNLFEGAELQATSERPLFTSGLLPTRTPADVYRRVVLDRFPTFVARQEVGDIPYYLAAAPVRAGGREGIVTVPVPLRQEDIESQIDNLDRRVLSAAVMFILLGSALGYGMAERIADPISRLTRATRKIARGNLDARVAAAASDELGRLINDFNRMADDLKRQRSELERTQRLEAWADMARQVAHDIKNPLTPIQLSAEHAQRVNLDRGRPLSPILDDCIAAILSQVRLLRQISAEFSNFASTATAHPQPTHLSSLMEEVVSPYRSGLTDRIAVEVRVADDLPIVNVDRTLLARAFTNVIENALHAMPSGGTLSIVVSRFDESVKVEFTDTGVGMDPESRAKIFEPYFSTKAAGTGLGLTIAKRNIELNGGTIEVQSHKGIGTVVTMTLPIAIGQS